jgi:ATP-binding cassette, subfamily B, multidrug efflux pump
MRRFREDLPQNARHMSNTSSANPKSSADSRDSGATTGADEPLGASSAWAELKRIAPLFRRYRKSYIWGALALVSAVIMRISVPYLLGNTVDRLRNAAASLEKSELLELVVRGALAIVAVALLGAVLRTSSRILVLGTSRRAVHDLRNQVIAHLVRLSPSYYARQQVGGLMSRCVNDVQFVQSLLGPVFLYLAETTALYVVCLTFMAGIDMRLTGIALLPFPFFLWRARALASQIQVRSRDAQQALSEVSSKVEESLSGGMVIRSLALEEFDFQRFADRGKDYRDLNLKVTYTRARLGGLMTLLAALSTFVVLAVGGPMVVRAEITPGDFIAMVFYLYLLAAPTAVLGFVISSLQRGAAALQRVGELMDTEATLTAPAKPQRVNLPRGQISVRDLTIELENEQGESRTILDQVSFTVPAGSTLGIVGQTGSGKSILLQALARQLEVLAGHISIDGLDVCDLDPVELRAEIGYVPQESFLFSATLAENIALGKPEASLEQIEQAVAASRLSKDVDQLPDGYQTVVGERGLNLSGGQRQRAALARALLMEPRILLMDDPFSAVDSHTTDEILAGLIPFMQNRTCVLVAHRVATVAKADRILVLHEGKVAESGTHQQLLQAQGLYSALYQRQQERESLNQELS